MTSAPMSASSIAQNGAGPMPAISTTRRSFNGPMGVLAAVIDRSSAATPTDFLVFLLTDRKYRNRPGVKRLTRRSHRRGYLKNCDI
jgi:hypothetical protein